MAAVYSTPFLEGHAVTGTQLYTVPDGYRAVLRDLDGVMVGEPGTTSVFNMIGELGQLLYVVTVVGATFGQLQWRGRQVFLPGQTFGIATPIPTDYKMSGYLLTVP